MSGDGAQAAAVPIHSPPAHSIKASTSRSRTATIQADCGGAGPTACPTDRARPPGPAARVTVLDVMRTGVNQDLVYEVTRFVMEADRSAFQYAATVD
jgi:hypothetical protein